MNKRPNFAVVLPFENRPVMLDDTCYFLGFDHYKDCLFTATILNSAIVKDFLDAIVFIEAKRPYTKEILMRLDLLKFAEQISFKSICDMWIALKYAPIVNLSEIDYENYKQWLVNQAFLPSFAASAEPVYQQLQLL